MTDPDVLAFPLPDARARGRIQEELDLNLLVEAGAGSGKTTELVNRMVALVAGGAANVEQIAAVTFTRKAAGELRQRFQNRLEERAREGEALSDEERARVRRALDDIDRAFLGTIHAFCARLLRERPLEVGLDPSFQELAPEERAGFYRRFWEAYLERLARDSDPVLEELSEAGLRTTHLYGLFKNLAENPDVDFPAPESSPPSASAVAQVRKELEALVRAGVELMPPREPEKGWDPLQKKLRTGAFTLDVAGWGRPADFFAALALLCRSGKSGHKATYNRWREKDLAKDLERRANEFGFGDTPAVRLLNRWYAHRYALALRLARNAAEAFAEHRRRTGRLDFQDLLLLTARLLRTDPGARRALGARYRYLLVDEFQDTDPLQAEIMLLLASDPPEVEDEIDDGVDETAAFDVALDWRAAVPRPGALFVVGDPKQSIYRFRRADIQLYELVKRRFAEFGGVVELTANFRSRAAIGDLVNDVFDKPEFLPSDPTPEQARFEPLLTRPKETAAPHEGVFWYGVHPERDNNAEVAEDDANRIATWVRDRVARGERRLGDFLVLTRVTRSLSAYARAFERHGVPVQVTGAGIGVEYEIDELLTLIECMIDPTNPVKAVAVLTGLFFGLDHERLVAHKLDGGSFDVMRLGQGGEPATRDALRTLHGWWRSARREPADVFLGRVVPELGLLPLAAGGTLGTLRAGALSFALDAVRASALAGDASLPGALEALRAGLAAREAEAPLEPGRADVVRVMNLHQAKGLEAPVVILADPSGGSAQPRDFHVERREDGTGVGYLQVEEYREGRRSNKVLARPEGWDQKEVAEARFDTAEQVRLLYVAVTRAGDELVVARRPDKPDSSPWSPLDDWLLANATELALEPGEPAPMEALHLPPEEARARVQEAQRRLEVAATPSYRQVSVTDVAKQVSPEGADGSDPSRASPAARGTDDDRQESFRGYSWGSAVHEALAVAAENNAEAHLRSACRALLVEHGRPVDDHGEPLELEEILALVRSVRASPLWQRAGAAGRVLAEVPFAVAGVTRPHESPADAELEAVVTADAPKGRRQLDLFGAGDEAPVSPPSPTSPQEASSPEDDGVPSVLEGVIDLAFREKGGWVIADYKTDVGTDPDFPRRFEAYRRQVDLYAEAWTRLTGEPVKERVLFFTAQDRMESW